MALKNLSTRAAADSGIEIEITHPDTGEGLGIFVGLYGSDSEAYLEADRRIQARNLALAKKKRDFTAAMDPEIIERDATERMVACFRGWKERRPDGTFKETVEFEEGVELPGTKEAFRTIISDRGFYWLRQQVREEIDRVSNFLPKGASSSSPPPSSASATTAPERTE